jgi:predicted SAM-dependent methyltransferase
MSPFFKRELYYFLRSILLYGNNFSCPVCNWKFRKMLDAGIQVRKNARCPRCSSLERHRSIWAYIQNNTTLFNVEKHFDILHVSPEFCFARKFRRIRHMNYVSIDLDYSLANQKADITALPMDDSSFDCFICLHVLEHVENDKTALKELNRVLKPGGWGIIQVPMDLSLESTFEDSSIQNPEDRKKNFWQHDHVRLYGKDTGNRISNAGFKVNYIEPESSLSAIDCKRFNINPGEPFYFVTK